MELLSWAVLTAELPSGLAETLSGRHHGLMCPPFHFIGGLYPNKPFAYLTPPQHLLPAESNYHNVINITTCTSCRHLRFVTFKFHSPSTRPVSASPDFQGSNLRAIHTPILSTFSDSCHRLDPKSFTPESWGPHPQRVWTPLFPHHFCRHPEGAALHTFYLDSSWL